MRFGAPSAAVVLLAAASLPLASCADEQEVKERPEPGPAPVTDADFIAIPGRVMSFSPDSFLLDYGAGRVTVKLDGWDLYGQAGPLSPGDRVLVRGEVRENLFDANVIEPTSVFVDKLDSYFYPDGVQAEITSLARVPSRDLTAGGVEYVGRVTDASGNSFTLGSGRGRITVETGGLTSPLAGTGRIARGDRVYVWGNLENGLQGGKRLVAKGLVELIGGELGPRAKAKPLASSAAAVRPG